MSVIFFYIAFGSNEVLFI